MKKKRFPPVWQPGEGLALMIFRRVLTNQAWLRLSVPLRLCLVLKFLLVEVKVLQGHTGRFRKKR